MFETIGPPIEERVPAFGGAPQSALSPVVSAVTEEMHVSRVGSFRVVHSSVLGEATPEKDKFFDEHFLAPQLRQVERNPTPGHCVDAAIMCLQIGRTEDALAVLDRARPQGGDFWLDFYRAVTLQVAHRIVDAEAAFVRMTADYGRDWRALHALGRLYIQQSRLAEGVAALSEASANSDADATVLSDLGFALIVQNELRQAMRALREATRRDIHCAVAHNNQGVWYRLQRTKDAQDRAVRSFATAIACDPECAPAIQNLAECYIVEQKFTTVIDLLEPRVELAPNDVASAERLAWAHFKSNNVQRAITLLRNAVVHGGTASESLLNNLAVILRSRGLAREAETVLAQALKRGAQQSETFFHYGELLRDTGRWSGIVDAITEQQALKHPRTAALRSLALAQIGQAEEGYRLLETAHSQYPTEDGLLVSMSHLLCSHLDRPGDAITKLVGVVQARPEVSRLLVNNLSYALIKAGRLSEARDMITPSISTVADSDRSDASICLRATWGLLRIREGAFDEGITVYRKALALASSALRPRLKQKILVEEGRFNLPRNAAYARKRLRQAIEDRSDSEFVKEAVALLKVLELPN